MSEIPKTVLIGAIEHQVQVHEGAVVFSQTSGFWGCHSRMTFTRDLDGMLWYLEFSETFGKIPVCHVIKAFGFVKEWFGGDFEFKRPAEKVTQ